jgi:hypothetical protein
VPACFRRSQRQLYRSGRMKFWAENAFPQVRGGHSTVPDELEKRQIPRFRRSQGVLRPLRSDSRDLSSAQKGRIINCGRGKGKGMGASLDLLGRWRTVPAQGIHRMQVGRGSRCSHSHCEPPPLDGLQSPLAPPWMVCALVAQTPARQGDLTPDLPRPTLPLAVVAPSIAALTRSTPSALLGGVCPLLGFAPCRSRAWRYPSAHIARPSRGVDA